MEPNPETSIHSEPSTGVPTAAAHPETLSSVPEDLRTPWDWIDLVIFALLAVGGTFLISIALMFIFSAFGIRPAQIRTSPSAKSYFAIVNQILVSFGLLGYLAAQTNLREGKPFWRTVGWRPLETKVVPKPVAYALLVAGGLLLSMFVQFSSGFFRPKGKLPIETFFQDRGSALLLMLVSVLLAPVIEETIFRGFIYPVIARLGNCRVGCRHRNAFRLASRRAALGWLDANWPARCGWSHLHLCTGSYEDSLCQLSAAPELQFLFVYRFSGEHSLAADGWRTLTPANCVRRLQKEK